jgi:DNA (cytosine-5)-methyltransferase 1
MMKTCDVDQAVLSAPFHRGEPSAVRTSSRANTNAGSLNLEELVTSCYRHVAPRRIRTHLARVSKLQCRKDALSTPLVIGRRSSGIPFADIFCGAGGLSLGFELEGATCKYALDHDASSIETFAINRPVGTLARCIEVDDALRGDLAQLAVPLLIGGPPCQGFSLANQQPTKADPRNALYEDFLCAAELVGARILVMENVPGILKAWGRISADLGKRGFQGEVFTLEASDFGLPQRRKRVFIVALKEKNLRQVGQFMQALTSSLDLQKVQARKSILRDALHGLPKLSAKTVMNATHLENHDVGFTIAAGIRATNAYLDLINDGFSQGYLFNHRSKYNNQRDIHLFSCLKQGEDTTSPDFARHDPYKRRAEIFKDKFYRLHEERLSKTITAHMYYDCHMYIHPHQNRGLTPREAARVQGYPDEYVFLGKPNEWYRQIGNSVSPVVARCLAKALLPLADQVV